ncbi:MAG: hypothetical protein AUI95_02240 [Crenarchaeota archaeon 13_1_40CM_3_52_4]|nr:MAG: hypothetical protein AUI95_02240 [Crenarchaeota archaeon 13_1_40CM_3_52_4]
MVPAVIVRTLELVPPRAKVKDAELNDVVTDEGAVAVSATVPVKLLTLLRLIVLEPVASC